MKAFNLEAETKEFDFGKISVIALGERGRGRYEVIVPCPLGIKNGDSVDIGKSRTGKPKIVKGKESGKEWLARVSTQGAYIRGAYGNVKAPKNSGVETIVKGYGAFGDAGRIGTWYDYLLKVPDNTILRVIPSRGDYYYLAFGEREVNRVSKEEIDLFLDNHDYRFGDFEEV